MVTKLTLSIEEKVVITAKKYAGKKGQSLSKLVENYLKSISTNDPGMETLSPKVSKLMGVIKLPEDYDYKKELGGILYEKYKK